MLATGIDTIIAQLEQDPSLSLTECAKNNGMVRTTLRHRLIKANREDLLVRTKKSTQLFDLDIIIAQIEADDSLSIKQCARNNSINFSTLRNKLLKAGRTDLLSRKQTRKLSAEKQKLFDAMVAALEADPKLSITPAAKRLGILPRTALNWLDQAGLKDNYLNRIAKKKAIAFNKKCRRVVKQLRADPSTHAKEQAKKNNISYDSFLKWLKVNEPSLVRCKKRHQTDVKENILAYIRQEAAAGRKVSINALAIKHGLNPRTVGDWVKKAEIEYQTTRVSYTEKQKQQFLLTGIALLEGDENLTIEKAAKQAGISNSAFRDWLSKAGRDDLLHRHLSPKHLWKGHQLKDQVLTDLDANKRLTISAVAQKYGLVPHTIKRWLNNSDRLHEFERRRLQQDYESFEIGNCYQFGDTVYLATPRGLICRDPEAKQFIRGFADKSFYSRKDESFTALDLALAWGLESTHELDDVIAPYFDYNNLVQV
jgi:transposase-like protein